MEDNRRIRLGIMVSFTILILLMTVTVTPVAAYGNSSGVRYNKTGNDPHDWITFRAINILGSDGYSKISSEANSYFTDMQRGSYDADWGMGVIGGLPVAAKDHYCDPTTGFGFLMIFQGAGSYAQGYFDKAVNFYKGGNKEEAYYNLGFAIHVLQDVTVPHHTQILDVEQKGHEDYERYINKKETYIKGINGPGYYEKATSADGWVRFNAKKSHSYHTYVNGAPNSGNNNYWHAASNLLPIAVKTTAGFLRFFFEQANQGKSEAQRSGSLSGTGTSYVSYVDVPFGDHTVVLVGNEPGADVDLYVKWGSTPSYPYTASSWTGDSMEKVTIRGKGRLYFKVYSWKGSSSWKLAVIYGKADRLKSITNSLSYSSDRTDTFSLKGGETEGYMIGWAFLAGPDGNDFDLYVRWERAPTTTSYYDRGYSSRPQEICDAKSPRYAPSSGYQVKGYLYRHNYLFYVMVKAYRGSGDYMLLILIF
ncbi:MAG: zinc dependent phospholipase C family protein [Candidatus Thorarchaeota archaeon]